MRHQQDSRSRRKPRHRKSKTTGPASEPRYFSTHATVVTTPKNECTIFRGNELRREVTLEAVLHGQDSSSRYPLRFTNKSILELASKLKPGDQIVVTIAAGGGAGTNYGGSGGTTSFGGLFFANGGSVGSGTYAPHYGGGGSINLVNGTYGSLSILPGENKFWTGSNGNPNQSITVPGGAAGGSFSGSGGRGGDAERTNPYVSAKSGQRGAVLISYEPSGTHQACVWIP